MKKFIQQYLCGSKRQVLALGQVEEYVELLNGICQENGVQIAFCSDDFKRELNVNNGKKIWSASEDGYEKIKQWLFETSPDLKQETSVKLYRFLPYSRFDELFEKSSLRMSSMAANWKFHGPGEYEEYFKVISPNYDKKAVAETAAHTFLLCFTHDWKQRCMWESYVNNYEGFCLEVDVMPKDRKNWFWKFREVSYANPSRYKFLLDAVVAFKEKYDVSVVLPCSSFACIYKGPKFSWEKETRIYISEDVAGVEVFREMYANAIGKNHETKSYVDEKGTTYFYMDMPLDNELFKLEIQKVYLGKGINSVDLKQKENILHNRGIQFDEICMSDPRLV